MVVAECFGQKQQTSVKYETTSCVYDELLIFNLRDLDKEAFAAGVIRLSVLDVGSTLISKRKLVGFFSIDAAQVGVVVVCVEEGRIGCILLVLVLHRTGARPGANTRAKPN